jgi:hypothetical protein
MLINLQAGGKAGKGYPKKNFLGARQRRARRRFFCGIKCTVGRPTKCFIFATTHGIAGPLPATCKLKENNFTLVAFAD